MKKIRILALVAVLIISMLTFSGCNKLKLGDVRADPMKYVQEGMDLTLGSTPFLKLGDNAANSAYSLKITGEETNLDGTFYLDTANKKAALEASFDYAVDYNYDEETDTFEAVTEKMDVGAYYADNELVLSSPLLEDYIHYDALGINFNSIEENFKGSDLYNSLLSMLGLTEEDLQAAEGSVDMDKLKKSLENYVETVSKAAKEAIVVDEVTEETLKLDETEIKTIVVSTKLNEKYYDNLIGETVKLVEEINAANPMAEQMSEDDIKAALEGLDENIPEISTKEKYYLSSKTGAVVKITATQDTEIKVDESENSITKSEMEINFGADPTKSFLPSINYKTTADGETVNITAKSSFTDGKFIIEGKVELPEEEDGGDFKLSIDTNGKYTLELIDSDGTITLPGTYTNDEKKFTLSIDLTDGYEEDDVVDIKTIELSIEYGKEVPAAPEHKDILELTEEDLAFIADLVAPEPSGAELYYYELYSYLDYETLDSMLASYEGYGYNNSEDMVVDLYITYTYQDLISSGLVDQAELDADIDEITSNGGTNADIADYLYNYVYSLLEDLYGDMEF